jgi:hypothetical protein
VQALLQDLAYWNGSDDPSTATRTVSYTLVDGDGTANGGADTATGTSTVRHRRQRRADRHAQRRQRGVDRGRPGGDDRRLDHPRRPGQHDLRQCDGDDRHRLSHRP